MAQTSGIWQKWSDRMPYIERNASGYRDPTASIALTNVDKELRKKRLGPMPLVYVCSPFRGDFEINLQNARRYCRFVVEMKRIPIAPHLLFPQFLGNEETEETRELALHMGLILLKHCREIWFFGNTVSEGMRLELNVARLRNIPVRRFTNECVEVPV